MVEMTPELAEACGIHAGDGYLRNKGHHVELDISGNYEEQSYYDSHVIPLFEKLFNISIKGRKFISRRTYGFVIRDKRIIEFFHSLGFPYGAKSAIVKTPVSIMNSNDKKIYASFIRGLLDTDGSICFRKNYGSYRPFKVNHHHYPHVILNTISLDLALDIKRILNNLDIKFYFNAYDSKKLNEKTCYRLYINGVDRTTKLMEIVGSKNPVKLSRYLVWKRCGFCPIHTTLKQREEILKGNLDVHSLKTP